MPPTAPPDAAPPAARWPRWGRPLLGAFTGGLFMASVALATRQTLHRRFWPDPPSWEYIGDYPSDLGLYHPRFFLGLPRVAVTVGEVFTHVCFLVPVALIAALFCARLGVERGRAPEAGTLPAWCLFGGLMLTAGANGWMVPSWPVFAPGDELVRFAGGAHGIPRGHLDAATWGCLFLACFATARADPPGRAGFGWTVAAGALGMGSIYYGLNALGSVAALCLYAWWSAGRGRALGFGLGLAVGGLMTFGWTGWRGGPNAIVNRLYPENGYRAGDFLLYASLLLATALLGRVLHRWRPDTRPAVEPENPPPPAMLSTASAHRITGLLWFVAWMGAPAAFFVSRDGRGVAFVVLPSVLATGLHLTLWLEGARLPATPPLSPDATPPPPAPVLRP